MELGCDFKIYGIDKKIPLQQLSTHFFHGIQLHNIIGLCFLNEALAFFREQKHEV